MALELVTIATNADGTPIQRLRQAAIPDTEDNPHHCSLCHERYVRAWSNIVEGPVKLPPIKTI